MFGVERQSDSGFYFFKNKNKKLQNTKGINLETFNYKSPDDTDKGCQLTKLCNQKQNSYDRDSFKSGFLSKHARMQKLLRSKKTEVELKSSALPQSYGIHASQAEEDLDFFLGRELSALAINESALTLSCASCIFNSFALFCHKRTNT